MRPNERADDRRMIERSLWAALILPLLACLGAPVWIFPALLIPRSAVAWWRLIGRSRIGEADVHGAVIAAYLLAIGGLWLLTQAGPRFPAAPTGPHLLGLAIAGTPTALSLWIGTAVFLSTLAEADGQRTPGRTP